MSKKKVETERSKKPRNYQQPATPEIAASSIKKSGELVAWEKAVGVKTPPSRAPDEVRRYLVEVREVFSTYEAAKKRAELLDHAQDVRVRVRRRRATGQFHVVVKTPRWIEEKKAVPAPSRTKYTDMRDHGREAA